MEDTLPQWPGGGSAAYLVVSFSELEPDLAGVGCVGSVVSLLPLGHHEVTRDVLDPASLSGIVSRANSK